MPDRQPRPLLRLVRERIAPLLVALPLVMLPPAMAQQYASAEELMAAVDARPEPSTTQAKLNMTITLASGQSLSRQLPMWADGEDRRLIKFTAPADIAGSGFLQIEDEGGTQTLVYLPALGRTRRIAGGQQGESFFGSDFSYEDITGIEPEDYTHTLLDVKDGSIYLVEAVPTAESGSTYDRLLLEVPEDTLVPLRAEYYRDGQLAKVLSVTTANIVDGYLVPTERKMETISNGSVTSFTVLTQTDVTFDEELPAELFTERYLAR